MLESPSQSDDDLLRLISKGHEPAFVEFYRKHQRAVYRFALHMSGKTEIAEEVTQDVFMAVMKAAKLETGLTIQVPPFVNTGDKVRVDTSEARYVQRV